MQWKTLLAYITETVDQKLMVRNEYLVAENRILRNQINGRVRLTDGERTTLATLGKRLGKQALAEVMSGFCQINLLQTQWNGFPHLT